MKSQRIIYLLFLIFCVEVNAKVFIEPNPDFSFNETQIDSLYSSGSQVIINQKHAQYIVDRHQRRVELGFEFNVADLKNLGLAYAYLKDAPNASNYLTQYIKKNKDIKVLDHTLLEKISDSAEYRTMVLTYKPKFDPWILFFIASGLIGIFLAIVLNLRKKGDTLANLLISSFVLFHSLFILHLSLYLTNYSYNFPNSYWATITFSFLYGPLLYFYFKRISEKHKFRWIDSLHLLPTIAIIIYFIPFYLLPAEVKHDRLFNAPDNNVLTLNIIIGLKALSLVVYSYLIYRVYRKQHKNSKTSNPIVLKWQRNMTALNVIYALTYCVYAFILGTEVVYAKTDNVMLYSQVVILGCTVLYVGYIAFVQPAVFSKKYLFADELLKYQKSGLTESFSNDLKEQLLKLLHEEKVYKINNINLDILSHKLNTTRHNLSQVINEHFDLNFFNLINKYRIQEAIDILKSDSNKNLNIIDVAYDVGFNNKVTFNKAFKEETKLTPTQYLQSLNGNHFITPA